MRAGQLAGHPGASHTPDLTVHCSLCGLQLCWPCTGTATVVQAIMSVTHARHRQRALQVSAQRYREALEQRHRDELQLQQRDWAEAQARVKEWEQAERRRAEEEKEEMDRR